MSTLNQYFKTAFKYIKIAVKIIFWAHITLFVVVGVISFSFINSNPEKTALMRYRSFSSGETPNPPEFIELRKVPQPLKRLLVKLEDPNFEKHHGFDIGAIKRAYKLNKKMGYKAYGGSTISQQLAKNLFLLPHKNYFRKYLELWISIEMDLIIGKERILEIYLNTVEWGDNIYGIQNASKHYYKKSVEQLTVDEQLRLITVIASPIKYTPSTIHKNKKLMVRYNFLKKHR